MPESGPVWELFTASGDYVTTKYGNAASLLAGAGAYKIKLTMGEARIEQAVEIAAGKTTDVTLALGAGVAEASAVFAKGGPAVPDDSVIELLKGQPALDGTHEYIATGYGTSVRFNVPAGSYLVRVTKDFATGEAGRGSGGRRRQGRGGARRRLSRHRWSAWHDDRGL